MRKKILLCSLKGFLCWDSTATHPSSRLLHALLRIPIAQKMGTLGKLRRIIINYVNSFLRKISMGQNCKLSGDSSHFTPIYGNLSHFVLFYTLFHPSGIPLQFWATVENSYFLALSHRQGECFG